MKDRDDIRLQVSKHQWFEVISLYCPYTHSDKNKLHEITVNGQG